MDVRSLTLYSNFPKLRLFIQKTKPLNSELLHSQAETILGGATFWC